MSPGIVEFYYREVRLCHVAMLRMEMCCRVVSPRIVTSVIVASCRLV